MESLYKRKGIYAIQNKINKKVYVGQTIKNFGDRRDSHLAKLRNNYHDSKGLQSEWNIYGEDNFQFVVLEELVDCNNIDDREKFWIKNYKDQGLAYNITLGGKGALGIHLSAETRAKIGAKNRINMTGRKASEETKRKMSQTRKGRKMGQEFAEKVRQRMIGNKMSAEARMKSGIAHSGEKCHFAKYTREQILKAREIYDNGCHDYKFISQETGIVKSAICGIVKRKRWKYI